MAHWSDLPHEILLKIAWYSVTSVVHLHHPVYTKYALELRLVCKSFASCIVEASLREVYLSTSAPGLRRLEPFLRFLDVTGSQDNIRELHIVVAKAEPERYLDRQISKLLAAFGRLRVLSIWSMGLHPLRWSAILKSGNYDHLVQLDIQVVDAILVLESIIRAGARPRILKMRTFGKPKHTNTMLELPSVESLTLFAASEDKDILSFRRLIVSPKELQLSGLENGKEENFEFILDVMSEELCLKRLRYIVVENIGEHTTQLGQLLPFCMEKGLGLGIKKGVTVEWLVNAP